MSTDERRLRAIQSELDKNRERMGQTLDTLQYRLSSENMLEQGRSYLHATGGDEFIFNLRRSARRNPVPLTLLGIGMGWLMLSGSEQAGQAIEHYTPDLNRGDGQGPDLNDKAARARQHTESAARDLRHQAKQVASKGQEQLDQAQERLSQASDRAQRGASRVGQATRRGSARLLDGADYMMREQPLVTTTLGLALGAVLAASLPHSRSEHRALGATRDDFVASAREAGREKAGQAQSVAESAAAAAGDAAQSEADRQGLHDPKPSRMSGVGSAALRNRK